MKPSSETPGIPTNPLLGYLIWIIDKAERGEVEKTLGSLTHFPFKFEMILISKTKDMYIQSFIDTHLFKIVKKTTTVTLNPSHSLQECLEMSSSLLVRPSPIIIYMVDGYSFKKETAQGFGMTFLKDTLNDMLIFKETCDGGIVFDPAIHSFLGAGFVFAKKDLTKLRYSDTVNVGSATGEVERLTKGRREPLLAPQHFIQTR